MKKENLINATSEERLEFWKKKVGLTGATSKDVYFYPKTRKDYSKVYDAFEKNADEFLSVEEQKWRLSEYKADFSGDTFSLYVVDDGMDEPTMELNFVCPGFCDLPVDIQIACCEIEWERYQSG